MRNRSASTWIERSAGSAAADIDLRRGQHRLRQQRERDRAADGDRLAERGRGQHLDRGAIARPVEPLRHLPDGEQQQRGDRGDSGQHDAQAASRQAATP